MKTINRLILASALASLSFVTSLPVAIPIAATVTVASLSSGCATRLDPGGVYNGDVVLYNADRAIKTAYDVIHEFVKFQAANNAVLGDQVRTAANAVRANAKTAVRSALALRDAYAKNPTPGSRTALDAGLDVLEGALVEAQKYLPKKK